MPIQQLVKVIQNSNGIVFFGGAGVSTASGIPDFRSANGLFHTELHRSISPEELVSHSFYAQHPEDFFSFYKEKLIYPDAQPNPCHTALAELERRGKVSAIITQNIDGLHQLAGSRHVLELHGSVHRNHCETCKQWYDLDYVLAARGIPKCGQCGGIVRPDVVLYEENLDASILQKAIRAIRNADILIIGGTSLQVYPAAGLIEYFQGRTTVLINKDTTPMDHRADLVIYSDIAAVFQTVMEVLTRVER